MRIAITAVFSTILALSIVLALYPVDKASTVHSTLTTETRGQDRWITGVITDVVGLASGTDLNLSEDVGPGTASNAFDIAAGGYLFIDETDAGAAGAVTIYCDENADGIVDGGETIVTQGADGRSNAAAVANCDFLRMDVTGYADGGDTVDIYYVIQVDRSSD